jgi:hypothetical protein
LQPNRRQWLEVSLHLALVVLALVQSVPSPEVRYRISATLDDSAGMVSGRSEIRYRHFGPGVLSSLSLRPGRAAVRSLRLDGHPASFGRADDGDGDAVPVSLPRVLTPGDSIVLSVEWSTRPDALRGRQPRRMDLVAWYPLVLDPSANTSITIPVLGTALLRLDLAEDQVIAGTGVPLCGDPGWERSVASPAAKVTLQRDWYRAPRDSLALAARCDGASPGRKLVTWYAEDVTELAFAASPTFRYEEGDFLERPVRALYERGGEREWGAGLATRRTETALAWILDLGGPYPWPQVTIIEAADGSALPMVVRASNPSQTSLMNLLARLFTEQILLGGDRTFTIGSAAFVTAWFFEAMGRRADYARGEREILDWDLDGLASVDEPLSARSPGSACTSTSCRRAEFMSHQLRKWGGEEAMRRLYNTLYLQYGLRPILPGTFQETARELIRPAPDPLYRQLPRGGVLYDDALVSSRRELAEDGTWHTTAVVERRAPGVFPRTLWVIADRDTAAVRGVSLAPSETLTVATRTRPRRVVLDPLAESHDWNLLNNERAFGLRPGWLLLAPHRPLDNYVDVWFSRKSARDRLTLGWTPTAWYSDRGGWSFGVRLREDYLGRFELNQVWASANRTGLHGRLALTNPVWLRATGWTQRLGLAWEEGRAAAGLEAVRHYRLHVADSTPRSLGVGLQWLTVTDPAYVDPAFYDDAGTVELTFTGRLRTLTASLAAGYAYSNAGATVAGGAYSRLMVSGTVRRPLGPRVTARTRFYAGVALSGDSVPRQRRIPLAGADAYQRFDSPLLRSAGSILARPGVFYHEPGGAGLRGLDPRLSAGHALGGTLELEFTLLERAPDGLLSRFALAGFADAGVGDGDLEPGRLVTVGDGGVGLRSDHRIGRTPFQLRFDFPFWVSRPALAQDDGPGSPVGFRWSFSFRPSF